MSTVAEPRRYPFNGYYGPDKIFLIAYCGKSVIHEIIGPPTMTDDEARQKMFDQEYAIPLGHIGTSYTPDSWRRLIIYSEIRRLPVDRDWWAKHAPGQFRN